LTAPLNSSICCRDSWCPLSEKTYEKKEEIYQMRLTVKILLLIFLLTVLASPKATFAQGGTETKVPKPVILTDDQSKYPLGLHLEILEDAEKTWTIDDVSSSEVSKQFVLSQKEVPNFGFTTSAYWVRFRVRNEARQISEWRLELDFAMMQYIDLYLPRSDGPGFDVKRTGAALPFDTRDVAYHRFVFKIPLAPGAEQTIYLRFESENSMPLSLTLWSQGAFAQKSRTESFIAGIFYGVLFIMIGYNAFLWLSLREKSYLYYVLFITTSLLYQLSYAGFAKQYLWPDLIWSRFAILLFGELAVISALKFTSIFLNTAVQVPILHKVITVWLGLLVTVIILIPFIRNELLLRPQAILGILSFLTMVAVGFVTWRQGYRPARYFLLAWIIYLITIITMSLVRFGFLPSHAFTEHAYLIGAMSLVLLLSLALADRINTFKQEKETAQMRSLKVSQENERLVREQNVMLEKKVEERTRDLKDSEARFRGLSESTFEGVFIHEQGTILEVNQAAVELFGYQRSELLGQDVLKLVSPASREAVSQHMIQKDETPYEVEGLRKDGSIFPLEVHGKMIPYQGREVRVAAVRDITLRKQTEETLRQAKQKAESANRAKSTFLANMSHELRTPLNVILGFGQIMALSEGLSAEHQEQVRTINRSGEHLLTLINQVLELSKIEAGRITLDAQPFDLYHLLADVENMFRLRAQKKGLQLIFERASDTSQYICTDEVKLRQVLINLLSNAVKFTEEGRVTLRIANCELRNEPTPHPSQEGKSEIRNLKFEIEDTGPGIAPEEVASLFEAFVQTTAGIVSRAGTGLGLAISRKFVQLMDGDITVESEVGRGTVFRFDIQVEGVDAQAIPGQAPTRHVVALEPNQPHYRILIVDDQQDNRQVLVNLLHFPEFALREARNGQEAVEIWETWEPHLIFMDIRMPVMDGYEATKRIRRAEEQKVRRAEGKKSREAEEQKAEGSDQYPVSSDQHPASSIQHQTIIIALTASSFEEEKAVVLAAGCDDFVRKPFHADILFEVMAKHLGVRYVYKESKGQQAKDEGQTLTDALMPQALAALPPELLENLEQVAVRLNAKMVDQAIEVIRPHNASVADTLARLAERFQYDQILTFIQHARELKESV